MKNDQQQKKNKFNQQASKMVLEPLTTNVNVGVFKPEVPDVKSVQR